MLGSEQTIRRQEQKYLITEEVAGRLREVVLVVCEVDPYCKRRGRGYTIQSLYLDTPTLAFHHAKLRDDPDRFKLRVRTYGQRSMAHLEIKRKVLGVVDKARVAVSRGQVMRAALGSAAPLKPTVGGRKVLGEFVQLMAQTGAQPQLLVRYVREAFLSEHDAYARVTLDRQLQVQRVSGWDLDGDPSRWLDMRSSVGFPSGEPLVVLELKWAGEMPMWMCDLITAFDLNAPGFSKYGQGVETCAGGDEGLSGLRSG